MLAWAKAHLTQHLMPWWDTHMVDQGQGGFYGAVDKNNTPLPHAPKFIVLNARLIWTYSACYATTQDPNHKALAQRAFEYVRQYFYDTTHGGFYTWLHPNGTVKESHKFTYGNAFVIYGLAEYARVFNCPVAKNLAIETAQHLNQHMWDWEHGGYFETASQRWDYTPHITMLHPNTAIQKTMNTHLHMIEAYANLLRIHDAPWLRSKVRELLYTIATKIVNPTNQHFYLFQTREWAPVVPDLTLGHDIEGSWLLYEAAEILAEAETLDYVKTLAIKMARVALDDGLNPDGAMHTEYHPAQGQFSPSLSWWEQCEAVVGFLNAHALTGEEQFLTAAGNSLAFIDKYFIDRDHGGWHAWINDDYSPQSQLDKADGYTCPYHNVRMCLEVVRRLG